MWDRNAGKAVGVYRSGAWNWIRENLTNYGLCWAWDDEDEEPWHWHLFEVGAPAVLAYEAAVGQPPAPPAPPEPPVDFRFDPAQRMYWLFPLNPDKEVLRIGSTGDTVRYLQGVCVNEVSRFALWFWAHEPEFCLDGSFNPRRLYLRAAADGCARMAVNGHYDEFVAQTIVYVQHAFSNSNFDGRHVGVLEPDGRVGRQQTWPFIDTLADGEWAA